MRVLQIADHTLCRVYLESSENSYHQPIVLDIFYRAQYTTSKPQIVRSESYEFHAHSNDIIFTSDQAGTAGADSFIYFEKVSFSTGRNVNIRKVEVFDGTLTVLDGSTTDTNGGTDEAVVSTFAEVNLGDNDTLKIGDGNDLQLLHDASNSHVVNYTGDLKITNNANDKDVIFNCDDGSGGNTAYITLDGSAGFTVVDKKIRYKDSVEAAFGSSDDMMIKHDGSDGFIQGYTGHLYIRTNADDKDVILQSDDGSGGVTAYLTLDGGVGYTLADKHIRFADDIEARFGAGSDLRIYHDGNNNFVDGYNGHVYIRNTVDDHDIVFQTDDGSGGITEYFRVDGSATTVEIAKATNVAANVTATKASDVKFEAKATTAGAFFKANSVGNGYFGMELFNDSTAKWFVGTYADHASIGANDFAIVSGSKVDGEIRFKIDSSGDASFTGAATVAGNLTANGNIIGDDSTNITNISRIEADAYAADADNTTTINMSATQIDCLVADTDVFQITDSDFTFDPAVKVSLHKRNLAKTSNTDADADGDIVYFGSTTSMDAGKIYYFTSSGTWALADADAESTAKGMLAVALGSASNTNGMLIRGMVTLDHDPGTIGDTVFLSTTAGQASSTAPSGNGDIVRVIGYCLDSTNGQIYFNPDGTFVEVTA